MSTLAVIPARGGSKRLPRKNLLALGGVPMIAYTIAAARDSGVFDRIVVSTDDAEIATVAREYGAEVPFLREDTLADDHTPVSAVTADMLRRLEAVESRYTRVAQLMPNCPLRTAHDVAASFESFDRQGFSSQVSVTRYGWQNPWWALELDSDGSAKPLFEARLLRRSQDLPPLFCPTGAVWWIDAESLRAHATFHLPKRSMFELPWERAVDIDDINDFQLAEVLLSRTGDGRPALPTAARGSHVASERPR